MKKYLAFSYLLSTTGWLVAPWSWWVGGALYAASWAVLGLAGAARIWRARRKRRYFLAIYYIEPTSARELRLACLS